jgi:SAM-dependent methyltransferase
MAYDFHSDRHQYFRLQVSNCRDNIIPFIGKFQPVRSGMKVLEIGCRDGGVLYPFLEQGCHITGIDLDAGPVEMAKEVYKDNIADGKANFEVINVHDYIAREKGNAAAIFDIIVLQDVIEHVFGQQEMLQALHQILKPTGLIFFGFPPWQNPFGGHQQVLKNTILSKIPYYHLLPNFVYYGLVKMADKSSLEFIKDTKETGISIDRFEKIVKAEHFKIIGRQLFLVSSMYKYKFGLKPRLQAKWLGNLPYIRNFFTTAANYVIQK